MSSGVAISDSPSASAEQVRRFAAVPSLGVLSLVLIAASHLPIVWQYCSSLLSLPQYEYILALPVFAGILLYSRVMYLGALTPGVSWGTALLFLLAATTIVTAAVFDSPWLGTIAALWALMATSYAWGGRRFVSAALPAWLVLWLMIRIPMEYDVRLVQSLQSIAAQRASVLLHLLGEPHILQGNIVETPLKRYAVEEACSGVQSLFAITACTVFFVLWSRMSWWRSLLLLAVSWWWVWAANVARVVMVTYLNSNYDIPIDTGWMHDALGLALFGLTLGLIYSSGRFLWFLFPYGIFGRRDGIDPQTLQPTNPDSESEPTRFPRLAETPLSSVVLLVFYLGIAVIIWLPQLRLPAVTASPGDLEVLGAGVAPASSGEWVLVPDSYEHEQRSADSQWGAHSKRWRYSRKGRDLIVSLDYPFLGWHELATCYIGSGWTVDTRSVVDVASVHIGPSTVGNGGGKFVSLKIRRPVENDFGIVAYQLFNNKLDPLPVPDPNVFRMLSHRFQSYRERLATLGASGSDLNSQTQSFQLQVFLQDHLPLSEQDERDVRQLLVRFHLQLAAELPAVLQGARQ